MSVLISDGLMIRLGVRERIREGIRKGTEPKPVPGGARVRRSRVRAGETLRPPTRAHVVAGRSRSAVASCAPRQLTVRWPWLAGLAVAACLAITGLGLLADGMAPAEVPAQTATVFVSQGETLTDLAARFAPDSDTGAVVERIKRLNGLDDAVLVPGLPLTVPIRVALVPAGS
jgi:hypothetical protein